VEKSHELIVPQGDGKSTTVSDANGKAIIADNSCVTLSEHVGEKLPMAIGLMAELDLETEEAKTADSMMKRYQSNYARVWRVGDELHFKFHRYSKISQKATDDLVWIKVVREQAGN
jgi:hypothetical protein